MTHGNSGYRKGCRCDFCTRDHAAANSLWNKTEKGKKINREFSRKYRATHPERTRLATKKYRESPHGKAILRAYVVRDWENIKAWKLDWARRQQALEVPCS